MAENYAPQYSKGQSFTDGKDMEETVADSNDVSFETEFSAVETGTAIPGIHDTDTLLMKGSLKGAGAGSSGQRNLTGWAQYGPIFDVTGYGAVGDGTTDDQAAIQAAITAADAVFGGIVYFPSKDAVTSKTYFVNSALTTLSSLTNGGHNITFMGEGRYEAGEGTGITWGAIGASNHGLSFGGADGIRIINMTMTDGAGWDGLGFVKASGSGFLMDTCYLQGLPVDELLLINGAAQIVNATVRNTTFNGGGQYGCLHALDTKNMNLESLVFTGNVADQVATLNLEVDTAELHVGAHLRDINITVSSIVSGGAGLLIGDSSVVNTGLVTVDGLCISNGVSGTWCVDLPLCQHVAISKAELECTHNTVTGGLRHTTSTSDEFISISDSTIRGHGASATGSGVQLNTTVIGSITNTEISGWGAVGGIGIDCNSTACTVTGHGNFIHDNNDDENVTGTGTIQIVNTTSVFA